MGSYFKSIFLHFLLLSIILTCQVSKATLSCHNLFTDFESVSSEIIYTTGTYKETVAELDNRIADKSLRENLLGAGENGKYPVILIKRQYDMGLAYLYYRRIPNTDAIIIDMVDVPFSLRKKGISNELFASVFELEPNVKRVVFELDKTNKEIFDEDKSFSLEDRFKRTPIYKTLVKFGFTTIDHVSEHIISWKTFPHVVLSRQ